MGYDRKQPPKSGPGRSEGRREKVGEGRRDERRGPSASSDRDGRSERAGFRSGRDERSAGGPGRGRPKVQEATARQDNRGRTSAARPERNRYADGARTPRDRGWSQDGRSSPGFQPDDRMVVCGIHPVEEFLDARPELIRQIILDSRTPPGAVAAAKRAASAGISVRAAEPDEFEELAGRANAQGIVAVIKPMNPVDGDSLIEKVAAAGEGLLVALDSVQDPQNLGSILRTAAFFGADGIILPKDRSVRLTSTAVRASAGGAARVPVGEVVNLARTLQKCVDMGMAVAGTVVSGGRPIEDMPKSGARVIVLGSEGAGMRRLVRESCSMLVTIPSPGSFESLNVGVAAGILICAAASPVASSRGSADAVQAESVGPEDNDFGDPDGEW